MASRKFSYRYGDRRVLTRDQTEMMESVLLGARWGQQRVARIRIPNRVTPGKRAVLVSWEAQKGRMSVKGLNRATVSIDPRIRSWILIGRDWSQDHLQERVLLKKNESSDIARLWSHTMLFEPSLWTQASYLTSVRLSFHIRKLRMIVFIFSVDAY